MIESIISKLENKTSLSREEITNTMDLVLGGKLQNDTTANFLKLLTEKGETDEELLGMLEKMQEYCITVSPKTDKTIIDVCGTGGDNLKTFNISTTAAFVIAAAGGVVAKHGNRSVSGVSGSADIFEYFGYDLTASGEKIAEIIEKFGIGFIFAQKFHPAMKNVAQARKLVGGKTAFNILGPLSNPAKVKNQLIGVFSEEYLLRLIHILKNLDAKNIMTVRAQDGLDELSTTSKNQVCLYNGETITSMILDPQKIGLSQGNIADIQISTKKQAVESFVSVLNNTANKTKIEITALNAAGGLIVAGISDNFNEATQIALETIKNEKAYKLLREFVSSCGDINKLNEVETS